MVWLRILLILIFLETVSGLAGQMATAEYARNFSYLSELNNNEFYHYFTDEGLNKIQSENLNFGYKITGNNRANFLALGNLMQSDPINDTSNLYIQSSVQIFLLWQASSNVNIQTEISGNPYFGGFNESKNYLPQTFSLEPDFSSLLKIKSLFSSIRILDSNALSLLATIGRQPVQMQSTYNNYFINFILPENSDGIVLKMKGEKFGTFQVIGVDFMDILDNLPEKAYCCADYPKKNPSIIGNFGGDILSFRSGAFFESLDFLAASDKSTWRFYLESFFTRYGPVPGGTDRASGTGNFTDNDYVFHYGAASFFESGNFKMLLEAQFSRGIDRKPPDILGNGDDIATNGLFARSGIFYSVCGWLNMRHIFFLNLAYADGAVFDFSGRKSNYGFTAYGNHESGGLILNHAWGFRPYSLSLSQGISNRLSYGFYHANGAAQINFGYSFSPISWLTLDFMSWFVFDTTRFDNAPNIFAPNGIYKDFFDRYLGNENMVSLFFQIRKELEIRLSGDVFIPGKFYKSQTANIVLALPNIFAMEISARVVF
ncbi:MAG: hypothetical protein OEV66_03670 [Spirochaetia bacterium]|nr:hypothetical protein [Spirochaetia bacterium]